MKKLLCLLDFGLANAFSLNSFAQAVPKGSGVNMQYKHRPLGNIAIGLAALGLLFAVSVSAQSSEKQQKYDAAVAACKAVFYPKYCNFMNMDLSGLDLTAEPRNPGYDYKAGWKQFHVSIYFDGSDLRNANFKGRLLQNAGFRKSDVTGAIFEGTNTSGALFTGAIGVGSPPGSAIINTAVVPPTVAAPMARVVTKGDCDQITQQSPT